MERDELEGRSTASSLEEIHELARRIFQIGLSDELANRLAGIPRFRKSLVDVGPAVERKVVDGLLIEIPFAIAQYMVGEQDQSDLEGFFGPGPRLRRAPAQGPRRARSRAFRCSGCWSVAAGMSFR